MQRKFNLPVLFAGILGFLSVAFGAYADHGLKKSITPEQFESLATAIRYNQLHAIIIAAIGLVLFTKISENLQKFLKITAYIFTAGIILFSYSIYVATVTGIREFISLAPIGGITLMVGWIMLGLSAFLNQKDQ